MFPNATGSCPYCLLGGQDLALVYLKPIFRHPPICHGLSYGWLWAFYSFCLECLPQLCLPDKCRIIFHGYLGFSTFYDQSYPLPMIKLTALPSNVFLFLHSHLLLYTYTASQYVCAYMYVCASLSSRLYILQEQQLWLFYPYLLSI